MAEPLPNPTFDPDSLAGVPFHEAIAWHAQQAPWISGSSWLTMAGLAAEKGELASEATLLGMVDDVWTQIGKAVEEGLPYGDFTRNLAERLQSQWWRIDSPRLNLIYHNNVGNALMAGRYAQLTDPVTMAARPFWLFDAIMDARTTVDICVPRDGVVLPADDPWWKRNTPLLHHGCRSGIISLDPEEAADFGGVSNVAAIPMESPDTGWGSPASWVDWEPKPEQYHAPLWDEYIRYTTGLDYIHTKGEWDAKVQEYVKKLDEAVNPV